MSVSKLFKSLFNKKNLIKTFNEHIAQSNAVGLDRIRPLHFQKILTPEVLGICQRVFAGRYKFTPYKQKLISKGPAKCPRVISIPTVRDRLTLRVLCDFFNALYPYVRVEIPQIKIEALSVALNSGLYNSFIKIDLSSFYGSIKQEDLIKVLKKKIRKLEILNVIIHAIQNPTIADGKSKASKVANLQGVPQGLAISNILAEIFISEFDKKMIADGSFFYQRYVDDILILCTDANIDLIAQKAFRELKSLKLEPHEFCVVDSKSVKGSLANPFDYLGYRIANLHISVRASTIQKFESALAKIFTTYRYQLTHAKDANEKARAERVCEWRLNLRITGCIFEGRRLGWVFYFSQVDTTTALRAIDSTVQSLMRRFALIGKIWPKNLVKAFYETQRRNKSTHKYIPNFDTMTIDEKREILESFLVSKSLHGYSNSQIESYFKMRIGAVVRELEKDLHSFS